MSGSIVEIFKGSQIGNGFGQSKTEDLFIKIMEESSILNQDYIYGDFQVFTCGAWNEISLLEPEEKLDIVWFSVKTLAHIKSKYSLPLIFSFQPIPIPNSDEIKNVFLSAKAVMKLLLKEKWPFPELAFSELVAYINIHFDKGNWMDSYPLNELLFRAKIIIGKGLPSEIMKTALTGLLMDERNLLYADDRKRNQKIRTLLDGGEGLPVNKYDFLGEAILHFCNNQPEDKLEPWSALLRLCLAEGTKGAPTANWLKEIEPVKVTIQGEIQNCMLEWLGICENKIREIHKQDEYPVNYLRDANIAILKGLLWCCPTAGSAQLQQAIADYVLMAYKKKPGVGPISMATGTAGLWNLSRLPVKEGIPRLLAVRNKITNNTILKSIDKLLREASEKNSLHPQEMEEIACPDYGMMDVGFWAKELGDYTAFIRERKFQAILTFEKGGKVLNSVPAALKNEFAEELKCIKTLQKNISEQIRTHSDRLENTFLLSRQWPYANWKQLYIDHPLLGIVGRKIIWHFNNGSEKYEAIYHEGKMVQADGSPLPAQEDETQVSLWHPIGFDSGYIFQWRQWLRENEIQQPFKQAFREVYLLTDAELRTDTYSNRSAAHIIRQHQFIALAKMRGWSYHVMGQWDSHNHPIRQLPWLQMQVEWLVDADWQGEANPNGIYNYITTDQVRFYGQGTLLHLYDVPALVFSELMRDIDLFVGVCSIGNDPNWQDSGNTAANTYWHNYSFSEELSASAEIRKETLQFLIPKMKIAAQCSFDKKFLVVKGRLRTYKIHMGSGNILMEPNDQYLCIVPDSQAKSPEGNLFIPFESDRLLSIIISKALLLAEDHKITDTTITRQIIPQG